MRKGNIAGIIRGNISIGGKYNEACMKFSNEEIREFFYNKFSEEVRAEMICIAEDDSKIDFETNQKIDAIAFDEKENIFISFWGHETSIFVYKEELMFIDEDYKGNYCSCDVDYNVVYEGKLREMWQDGDRIGMIADIIFEDKNKIENKQYFPVICPDCGNKAGHLYVHGYEAGKDAGGRWVWCSACHNYEHSRARLPKWWKNPDFIEFGKLCHAPNYLEGHKDDIDKWVNSLLIEHN